MKRSPLRRRTPLRSSSTLRRSGRLQPVSKKRAAERDDRAAVRAAVFARDGYRCRLSGVESAGACFGGLTPHHVLKASQGGSYTLDNLVTLCAGHNDRIEADADLARLCEQIGLVRRRRG